jgi:hypothetical protein
VRLVFRLDSAYAYGGAYLGVWEFSSAVFKLDFGTLGIARWEGTEFGRVWGYVGRVELAAVRAFALY